MRLFSLLAILRDRILVIQKLEDEERKLKH